MPFTRSMPIGLEVAGLLFQPINLCLKRILNEAVVEATFDPGRVTEIRKIQLMNRREIPVPEVFEVALIEVFTIPGTVRGLSRELPVLRQPVAKIVCRSLRVGKVPRFANQFTGSQDGVRIKDPTCRFQAGVIVEKRVPLSCGALCPFPNWSTAIRHGLIGQLPDITALQTYMGADKATIGSPITIAKALDVTYP
ncbi:MAG TPA: hypothetical protein DHV08_07760 [Rhodocyclaceae bacterium]|nr:hypothetical protein [Rhodocyclaceae bacterium]